MVGGPDKSGVLLDENPLQSNFDRLSSSERDKYVTSSPVVSLLKKLDHQTIVSERVQSILGFPEAIKAEARESRDEHYKVALAFLIDELGSSVNYFQERAAAAAVLAEIGDESCLAAIALCRDNSVNEWQEVRAAAAEAYKVIEARIKSPLN